MFQRHEDLHEVGVVLPAVSLLIKESSDRLPKNDSKKLGAEEFPPRLALGTLVSMWKVLTITQKS